MSPRVHSVFRCPDSLAWGDGWVSLRCAAPWVYALITCEDFCFLVVH